MASMLACPYCYRTFREREILFRCSGRAGPKGKTCTTSIDRVLASQMGDHEPRFPVFAANGRKVTAVHRGTGACEEETNYRICPHCHSQLPVHFGQVDSRMIALVGAKDSGKTVFMTVLLHELMYDVGRRFNAAVLGADEWTRRSFEDEYEKRLYKDHELYGGTKTARASAGGRRPPLVFSFTVDGRIGGEGRWAGGGRVRRSLLSFFDTAGEDLVSQQSVEANVRYLTSADGIILLLDPLQMGGARPLADPDAVPEMRGGADTPAKVLARIIELLHLSLKTKGNRLIDKPIAVAFSKMDALLAALPDESPLRRSPPGGARFDEGDSRAVHEHVRALLYDWEGGILDAVLRKNFSKYRFFGLSALGEAPVRGSDGRSQRISDRGIKPLRVEDPFLWLLSVFGTVTRADNAHGGG